MSMQSVEAVVRSRQYSPTPSALSLFSIATSGKRKSRLNVHRIHDRPFDSRERPKQNGTEA